jgi:hypothetical protein
MEMEATYLAWVDFCRNRHERGRDHRPHAKRAPASRSTMAQSFGKGGESFMRFNIATPRPRIVEAVARMERGVQRPAMRLTRSLFRLILSDLCLLVGFWLHGRLAHSRNRRCKLPDAEPLRPPLVGQIDRIVIEKVRAADAAVRDGKPVRTYKIALGFTPEGDKLSQGDGKTPGRRVHHRPPEQ